MVIYTGTQFILDVGRESAFASGVTGGYDMGSLGVGLKLSTFDIKNQFNPIYGVNQRTAQGWYSKGVDIAFDADFYLADDSNAKSWLDFVLTGSGGSATTPNTAWTSGSTVNSGYAQIQSYSSAYEMYTVDGIIFDTAKLSVKQGELASVTLSGVGTNEVSSVPTSSISVTPPSDVLSWKDATVEIGSTLTPVTNLIESLDMTITTSKQMIYGLGSLTYQGYYLQEFKVEGTLSVYHDSGIIEAIQDFGGTSGSSNVALTDNLQLKIGSYTFGISGFIRNEGEMDVPPVKEVMDKLSFYGTAMTAS